MVLLNLLPHRQMAYVRRQRRWRLRVGAGVGAGLLASAALYAQGQGELDAQRQASLVLEEALQALAAPAGEVRQLQQALRQGRERLQQWNAWRMAMQPPLRLLHILGEQLPAGIAVQRIEHTPGQIELQGVAASPEAVAALREMLDASGLAAQPVLLADVQVQQQVHTFRLTLPLAQPAEPEGTSPATGVGVGGAGASE